MNQTMTLVLFSSRFIFTLSKDFLRGVEQFAQRGTFSWNIFFCVEHFPWNILVVVEHFGQITCKTRFAVANGWHLPGPARLSQVTCNKRLYII